MPRVIPAVAGSANLDAAISSRTAETAYAFLRNGSVQVPVVAPSGAAHSVLTAGVGAFVNGSYVQIVPAAVLVSHNLIGVSFAPGGADDYEVDVATGAAASEVVIATIPIVLNSAAGFGFVVALPFPAQIGANARVAMRCRGAAGGGTLKVKCMFALRPY